MQTTPTTNYIITQCYGNEGVFYECAFALLSLSRLYPTALPTNTEIWIYTDNPVWFQTFSNCNLPLQYRQIDAATIQAWRGKIDFVHRVKIELLNDFTQDRQGNILYIDTDVVFTWPVNKMLEDIEAGKRYMHTMEGKICDEGNPVLKKLNTYLQANNRKQNNGQPLNALAMWNAGVLGFNTADAAMLNEVLAFTDNEYPQFPKHVVEQFAFSAFFQQAGAVKAAMPCILHYWNLKEARYLLASFFKTFKIESWQNLVAYSQLIQMPVLMQEKANFFQNRSIAGKLGKKKWLPALPDWKELIKQL
jgi:hypothetical protein